jgi:rhodanese-related sulfurtransferase
MKGLVMAALALALLVVGTAIALVFYRGGKEFKVFLGGFVAAVAIYALAFRLSPPDLGILPGSWLETDPRVDFGNGLLILALVFHGYWTFCYFACVSPSMSVLVALRARGRRGMTAAEALALHGGGAPVNLIFQRRLPKLVRGGYVREDGGAYRLLSRGGRVAALGSFLKRLINAEIEA